MLSTVGEHCQSAVGGAFRNLAVPPVKCVKPVQGGDAVHRLQAAARRHHVEALAAVAGHVQVVPGVPVFHHHDKPRPPVRQVVAGHPLSTLIQQKAERGNSCERVKLLR